MKIYYADENCINPLRISALILAISLIIVTSYFLAFIPILMITLCSIFFAAGFFTALIYIPGYFRNMKYYISDKQIIKVSGFYFIKKQTVKISKIQYIKTYHMPFKKIRGFNFILLHAYGGMLPIMFISENDFFDISCHLNV